MESSGEGINPVKPRLDYREVKDRSTQFRESHEWFSPGPRRVEDTIGVFSEVLKMPLDQLPTLTEIPEEFREDVKKDPTFVNVQRYHPETLKILEAQVIDYKGNSHSRIAILAVDQNRGDIAVRFYDREVDGNITVLGGNHDFNSSEFVDNLLRAR